MSPEETALWLYYINLTQLFLLVHHTQEDEFIFPFLREKMNDQTFMATETQEHATLHRTLGSIGDAVTAKDLPKALDLMQELYAMFCQSETTNHLAREEIAMTDEAYRSRSTEAEVKDLNTKVCNRSLSYSSYIYTISFFLNN